MLLRNKTDRMETECKSKINFLLPEQLFNILSDNIFTQLAYTM